MDYTTPNNDFTIIIVNDFAYVDGGATQVALTSAKALADLGYKVILFTAVGPVATDLSEHLNLHVLCLEQHDILGDPNRLRASVTGLWNIHAEKRMHSILQEMDPNKTIIHLHTWTKALSSSVIKMALKMKFIIVCTMHDYFLACPNGAFYNYPKNHICNLTPLSISCLLENCDVRNYYQKLWRSSRLMVQKRLGLLPDGVNYFIAVSDFSSEILKEYLPRNSKIFRVDNPIDIPKLSPVDVQKNQSFIAVGRISNEKGLSLLAQAAFDMHERVVFVGNGRDRSTVERINPSCQVTGWKSHEEVILTLRTGRALIFPSLLFETQGLVVNEAAALGLPAIVADTSAAREMVIDGKTGLWFKGGSLDDLKAKMVVLKDDNIAQAMGEAAYQNYWSEPKTILNYITALIKVYREILALDE